MLLRNLSLSLFISCLSVPVLAQDCDLSKLESTPISRFKAGDDGTLIDTKLKRTWLRCAIGMKWNGSTCEGNTLTYNFRDTLIQVDELNAKKVGGRSDWRLPTVDELHSIAEPRCFKPAINLQAFPFSPESGFWTGTAEEGVQPRAWIVHFRHGQRYIANKKQDWRIRLIAGK